MPKRWGPEHSIPEGHERTPVAIVADPDDLAWFKALLPKERGDVLSFVRSSRFERRETDKEHSESVRTLAQKPASKRVRHRLEVALPEPIPPEVRLLIRNIGSAIATDYAEGYVSERSVYGVAFRIEDGRFVLSALSPIEEFFKLVSAFNLDRLEEIRDGIAALKKELGV